MEVFVVFVGKLLLGCIALFLFAGPCCLCSTAFLGPRYCCVVGSPFFCHNLGVSVEGPSCASNLVCVWGAPSCPQKLVFAGVALLVLQSCCECGGRFLGLNMVVGGGRPSYAAQLVEVCCGFLLPHIWCLVSEVLFVP